MYFLLNFYKQKTKQSFPGLANYGVCFPDTKYIPTHTHPEMTRTNILFNHHLDDVSAWIEDLFNNPFYGYKNCSMNDKVVQDFNNILKPSLQIPLSMRSALRQQQKELIQINFFQDYLLDIFDDKNRVAFQGAAGTGKTWIALKKAIRLVLQGKNCLFLCYNSMLKKRLDELSKQMLEKVEGDIGKLDIYTFHAFSNHIFVDYLESLIGNEKQNKLFFEMINKLYPDSEIKHIKGFIGLLSNPNREKVDTSLLQIYREKGLDERVISLLENLLEENEDGYFNFNVPMGLLTLLEDNSYMTDKYDAIIIDEGQDFEKTWCDCLAYFLESKRKRIVYLFYDDNQNIFMKKKQLPIIDLISKYNVNPYLYHLRKNLRNTKPIHNFAINQTDLGKTAHSADIDGIEPEEIVVNSEEKARKEVGKIVTELINEHSISNGKLVVLTDKSVSHSVFKEDK